MSERKPDNLPIVDGDCCSPRLPEDQIACCGSGTSDQIRYQDDDRWRDGSAVTPIGEVPRAVTRLTWRDRLGHWKVRWGIGRMQYAIAPGLYAVGNPTPESFVFVTANFKMSFDRLRAALDGRDGWILVLDTKAINVWCAAGKGTFGTGELVKRIFVTRLTELVSHRKLILPQLGASGVAAHEVRKATGFTVRYGPVRASDLPRFLDSELHATPDMRAVTFSAAERLALAPMELLQWGRWGLLIALVLGLLSGFGGDIFSLDRALWHLFRAAVPILGGLLAGAVLTPLLLPWLPGRAFAWKGAGSGLIYLVVLGAVMVSGGLETPAWVELAATVLLVLATASFVGMNFTGSSTYTSLSGVRREMRRAVPLQAGAALVGLGFWIAGRFV